MLRDGSEVMETVRRWHPDLILLDLKLPRRDGWSILADLRENEPDTPVLVISALGDDGDKLAGFRLGCDDYVVKPFNPLEVVARATALIRRGRNAVGGRPLNYGPLRIDRGAFRAFLEDRPLDLTRVEFLLLDTLVGLQGRVASRGFLVDAALDGEAFGGQGLGLLLLLHIAAALVRTIRARPGEVDGLRRMWPSARPGGASTGRK